jgi:hypothetical protein
MKANLTLKSAINRSTVFGITALISLLPLFTAHIVFAADQTFGQQAQIFEIQNSLKTKSVENQAKATVTQVEQNSLSIEELESTDPLTVKLKAYFEKYNSPYAEYAAEIPKIPLWQKSIAISWVESNYCIKAMNKNCSSIGVAPGHKLWRKYNTELDWLKDMSRLMHKPLYSEKYNTFEKMRGVYVVPGSNAWVNGATQKYEELMKITAEAEAEQRQIAQINNDNEKLHTFSDLAYAN